MKKVFKISMALIALIIGFVLYIFITTGYFRRIENRFSGKIIKKVNLVGAEDITVSLNDSIAIISSTNRRANKPYGGLYLMNLKNNNFNTTYLSENFKKDFAPHGISLFKTGNDVYRVVAVNHTTKGHSIEVFDLINGNLSHLKTLKDKSMISPNDIVLIDENRFYFTNDHKYENGIKRLVEDYVGLAVSDVVYFDGANYKQVAKGIAYANGINIDVKRNLMYVASPRGFLVNVYSINENKDLSFIESIDCNTGVDNIELDQDGNLWIGAHPNLLRFADYAVGKEKYAPSEIIKISYRSKGDYSIEQVYLGDGSSMSASTVAAPFGNLLLFGNVMDDSFLILELD